MAFPEPLTPFLLALNHFGRTASFSFPIIVIEFMDCDCNHNITAVTVVDLPDNLFVNKIHQYEKNT